MRTIPWITCWTFAMLVNPSLAGTPDTNAETKCLAAVEETLPVISRPWDFAPVNQGYLSMGNPAQAVLLMENTHPFVEEVWKNPNAEAFCRFQPLGWRPGLPQLPCPALTSFAAAQLKAAAETIARRIRQKHPKPAEWEFSIIARIIAVEWLSALDAIGQSLYREWQVRGSGDEAKAAPQLREWLYQFAWVATAMDILKKPFPAGDRDYVRIRDVMDRFASTVADVHSLKAINGTRHGYVSYTFDLTHPWFAPLIKRLIGQRKLDPKVLGTADFSPSSFADAFNIGVMQYTGTLMLSPLQLIGESDPLKEHTYRLLRFGIWAELVDREDRLLPFAGNLTLPYEQTLEIDAMVPLHSVANMVEGARMAARLIRDRGLLPAYTRMTLLGLLGLTRAVNHHSRMLLQRMPMFDSAVRSFLEPYVRAKHSLETWNPSPELLGNPGQASRNLVWMGVLPSPTVWMEGGTPPRARELRLVVTFWPGGHGECSVESGEYKLDYMIPPGTMTSLKGMVDAVFARGKSGMTVPLTLPEKEAFLGLLRQLLRAIDVAVQLARSSAPSTKGLEPAIVAALLQPSEAALAKVVEEVLALETVDAHRTTARLPGDRGAEPVLPVGVVTPAASDNSTNEWKNYRAEGRMPARYTKAQDFIDAFGSEGFVHWAEQKGWSVFDRTGDNRGYDYLLVDKGGNEMFVEMKTALRGSGQVYLSRNERNFAIDQIPVGNWFFATVIVDDQGERQLFLTQKLDLRGELYGNEKHAYLAREIMECVQASLPNPVPFKRK